MGGGKNDFPSVSEDDKLSSQKQVVTCCPEIMVHERGSSGKEELLLLACDGVWDVFDDQDAGEFLVSALDVPLGEVRARAFGVHGEFGVTSSSSSAATTDWLQCLK